jgi:hypothetical protein
MRGGMLACFIKAMRESRCQHQWRQIEERAAMDLAGDQAPHYSAQSLVQKWYYCCVKCGGKRVITQFDNRM